MRPVPDKKRARRAAKADRPADATPAPTETFPARSLRPVGPARMKALREAIRTGKYPSDAQVLGGLARMLRSPK